MKSTGFSASMSVDWLGSVPSCPLRVALLPGIGICLSVPDLAFSPEILVLPSRPSWLLMGLEPPSQSPLSQSQGLSPTVTWLQASWDASQTQRNTWCLWLIHSSDPDSKRGLILCLNLPPWWLTMSLGSHCSITIPWQVSCWLSCLAFLFRLKSPHLVAAGFCLENTYNLPFDWDELDFQLVEKNDWLAKADCWLDERMDLVDGSRFWLGRGHWMEVLIQDSDGWVTTGELGLDWVPK